MIPATLSDLCTSCGKCCNGRVFQSTALTPDERQYFGRKELPQPCPYLYGNLRCAVYETRPVACREFLCPAANAFLRGELTLEKARAALQLSARP